MRGVRAGIAGALVALAAAGWLSTGLAQCAEDHTTRVAGKGECLAIRTFRPDPVPALPKLAIFIHGDQSDGGPVTSNIRLARDLSFPDTVAVAILRPGYGDPDGHASTGSNFQRSDSYTAHNIDAVAAGVAALKGHYNPTRTVLVGHSGGAAYSAVILGRHPGLVDAALLLSCPCNIRSWRVGRREWSRSESPIRYTGGVPAMARVIAITADDDTNTAPALAAEYVGALKVRNVAAEVQIVRSGGHNGTQSAPEMKAALRRLLDGGP